MPTRRLVGAALSRWRSQRNPLAVAEPARPAGDVGASGHDRVEQLDGLGRVVLPVGVDLHGEVQPMEASTSAASPAPQPTGENSRLAMNSGRGVGAANGSVSELSTLLYTTKRLVRG